MKKAVYLIIFLTSLWCAVSAVSPYWDKYWLEKDLKVAAIYGTKNSVSDTRSFLDQKMRENFRDFEGKDFIIEKDRSNTVYIGVTYEDRIEIFGVTLKDLELTAEATARERRGKY
jgi:hypothetical protein